MGEPAVTVERKVFFWGVVLELKIAVQHGGTCWDKQ